MCLSRVVTVGTLLCLAPRTSTNRFAFATNPPCAGVSPPKAAPPNFRNPGSPQYFPHGSLGRCPKRRCARPRAFACSNEALSHGLSGKEQVPAEAPFHESEYRPRHPAEIPLFDVPILDVVRDAVRKDVLDLNVRHAEAVSLQQPPPLASCVGVGHRAAGLRFRVFCHHVLQFPKLTLALRRQYPGDFPGPAVVDHDFDGCVWTGVLPKLLQYRVRMRRVVDYAEGVNQIIALRFH